MRKFWTVAREWEGETCAILCSGPSMTRKAAELVRSSGCRVIAVNNQAIDTILTTGKVEPAMAPWADILYAADGTWWYHNAEAVSRFVGRKVSITQRDGEVLSGVPMDTLILRHGGMCGFDERPNHLRTGWNSGYQAVHLALHLGAKRIVLCGADMTAPKGSKEHWFGDHHWKVGSRSRYHLFITAFTEAASEFQKRANIYNTTLTSSLRCFPFKPLEEALDVMSSVREAARSRSDGVEELEGGVCAVDEGASSAVEPAEAIGV